MVWIASFREMRSAGFAKFALSLAVCWSLSFLLPSRSPLGAAIGRQMAKLPSIQLEWTQSERDWIHHNASKLAVMIDSQPSRLLTPVILQTMVKIPEDWPFLFLGSEDSIAIVNASRAIQEREASGKLQLKVIPTDLRSVEGTFQLLSQINFYEETIPQSVEWLFLFSKDTVICGNGVTNLDDWLRFDYVSNSWADHDDGHGFSIRNVAKVRRILSFQERANDTATDGDFFRDRMKPLPGSHLPNDDESAQFVVEHRYQDKSLAFHIGDISEHPEVWNNTGNRQKIYNYCPEVRMIMSPMKLMREKCDG